MKRLLLQALHFFGLSGIGWILDFSMFVFLSRFSSNLVLNNTISSWVGVTFVFYTATRHVFQNDGGNLYLKYVVYLMYQILLIYTISKLLVLINALLNSIFVEYFINSSFLLPSSFLAFLPVVAKIIVTPITMILNFIVMKGIVEKGVFKQLEQRKIILQREDMVQAVPSHIDQSIVRTFYYDESNNLGKLWLKPDGEDKAHFNADVEQNFVIAGIVTPYDFNFDDVGLDQQTLLSKFGLVNSQTTELKFKGHFSEPDFLHIVSRPRTLNFLKLIDELDVDMHVTNVNNLYFCVVDIIDSFIDDLDVFAKSCLIACPSVCSLDDFFLATYRGLKELLYSILHANLDRTEALFVKYKYPNIKNEEQTVFCDELLALLRTGVSNDKVDTWYFDAMISTALQSFSSDAFSTNSALCTRTMSNTKVNAYLFDKLIEIIEAGKESDAIFLKLNRNGVLIDNYSLWYLHLAALFSKSQHIFDKSRQISQELARIEVRDGNTVLNNYSFVDSKDSIGVQLSDVIAGLYAKLYTHFNKKTIGELKNEVKNFNEIQFECLRLLNKFQKNSNAKNEGFFYSTVPASFMMNVASWLEYCELFHTECRINA